MLTKRKKKYKNTTTLKTTVTATVVLHQQQKMDENALLPTQFYSNAPTLVPSKIDIYKFI